MRPMKRLVVAERTKFMSMKQEIDEHIIKYLHCLRNASRYCEFKKLGQEEQTIEEDLIQLRLIEGMYNASHWYKNNGMTTNRKYVFKYLHWLYKATRINTKIQPLKKSTQRTNICRYLHSKKDF